MTILDSDSQRRPLKNNCYLFRSAPLFNATMSNSTTDAELIQEVVQEVIVQNYIGFATLGVLTYDIGQSLHPPLRPTLLKS